jgi:2-methylcitrate dehydratase PrpD
MKFIRDNYLPVAAALLSGTLARHFDSDDKYIARAAWDLAIELHTEATTRFKKYE